MTTKTMRDPLLKRTPKKAGTKGRRHTVMQDQDTIHAVCLAEIGKGNDLLRQKYGLGFSDGQFSYRLRKAKEAAGMAKGDGFRKAWREGRSPYEEICKAMLPELERDYEQNILPKFEVPRAKGAGEQQAAA